MADLSERRQCDHISEAWTPSKLKVRISAASQSDIPWLQCTHCGKKKDDLWLCLHCCKVLCGRASEKHALKHFKSRGHSVVLQVQSRMLWCYSCDCEIIDAPDDGMDSDEDIPSDKCCSKLASPLRRVLDALEPASVVVSKPSSFPAASGTASSTSVSTLNDGTSGVSGPSELFTLDEQAAPDTDRGLCGLSNLGNTCFLNSVVQALSNVPAFARQFAEVPFSHALAAGSLPLEFADTLRAIWSGRYGRIAPSGIFRNLRRLNPMFDGYEQHDAQEALRFLINDMHDKLSVDVLIDDTMSPPSSPVAGYASTPLPVEYSRPVWMDTGPYMGPPRSQQSIISDIFRGSLYSTVTCKACGGTSTTRDHFYDLSLPIPKRRVAASASVVTLSSDGQSAPVVEPEQKSSVLSSMFCKLFGTGGTVRLSDCLHAFFDAEPLTGVNQYDCERCRAKCDAEKSLALSQLPETLCLHLKRFSYHSVWGSKVSSHVSFPLEGLDVSPWLRTDRHSPPKTPGVYDLTSIVVHLGGMSGGHYIAYGRNRVCGKWYQFDDSSVSLTSPVDVANEQAYILFYTRRRLVPVPLTIAPSSDPYCYVSKQWLMKAVSTVHPGPATAHPIACEHMHVKQSLLPVASRLVVALSEPQWRQLTQRFGHSNSLRSLSACPHCQDEATWLEARRDAERERITAIEAANRGVTVSKWYIVSEVWLKRWRSFIENSGSSDGTGRGVLPPGPIDNTPLLKPLTIVSTENPMISGGSGAGSVIAVGRGPKRYDTTKPLPNLKPIKHYRGLSEGVWKEFSAIYGGGPEIIRDTVDIYPKTVVNTLSCWQPLRRLERMRSIAQRRRLDIELVLENIVDDSNAVGDLSLQVDVFHGHINASLQAACIRTADALGIQTVHVIESFEYLNPSRSVHRGALNWLSIHRWPNVQSCTDSLKAQGRPLLVSDLSPSSKSIFTFQPASYSTVGFRFMWTPMIVDCVQGSGAEDVTPLPPVFAVAFGNEHRGASTALLNQAAATFNIPMVGFTQSLNISAAAAASLMHFLTASPPVHPSEDQRDMLLARWLILKVPRSRQHLKAAGIDLAAL